jgi:hypothetical protein
MSVSGGTTGPIFRLSGVSTASWTALLDAVRLGPTDDATAVTAEQLRAVVARLTAAGHWRDGDPHILIVADAGYDITRLAFVLADLPVELLGRIRSDRVLRGPKPPRPPRRTGRPPRNGAEFALDRPVTWPEPAQTSITETTRYGTATATSWDRLRPRGDPPRLLSRLRRRPARARGHPHPPAGRAPAP